jgi:hypothetical protein
MSAETALGREEIFTLFSDMIPRGAVQFFRQLSRDPSVAASRRPARARSNHDFAAFEHVSEQALVLRILIEAFGGEVASSTLRLRLARMEKAKPELWLRRILDDLERCGALTLEDVNGTDVIVRILPLGGALAYDLPAFGHQGSA